MRRGALTLSPDANVFEALRLCHDRRIRHVPILEDDQLVGILSDRDIRDVSPPLGDPQRVSVMKEKRVGDVMTRKVATTHPQDTIEHAAREMYERRINALPVVAEERLVGIITTSDVMRALVTFSGGVEPEVADIIREQGVDVFSVLSSPQKISAYDRTLLFHLMIKDPSSVVRNLEGAGYEVSWPDSTVLSDEVAH